MRGIFYLRDSVMLDCYLSLVTDGYQSMDWECFEKNHVNLSIKKGGVYMEFGNNG